jgi:hypothetical protein
MNKKSLSGVVISAIVILGVIVWLIIKTTDASIQEDSFSQQETRNSVARWVSDAATVHQLMKEVDLAAKVRVIHGPTTRVVQSELPIVDEPGTEIIGTKMDEMAFSDTDFEVLEVYFGKPKEKISVMQTGGVDPKNPDLRSEMRDDPLYKIGEEYVLFLVDISGDPIQAPDREIYRIVNPYGRYKIEGEHVVSYGENHEDAALPKSLDELISQIKEASQNP